MPFNAPSTGALDPQPQGDRGSFFVPLSEACEGIAPGLRETVERVRPIEKAWVEFLSVHPWQWFGTFTYKDPIHPEAADKQFRLWTRHLDEMNGVQQRKPRDHARRCIWVRGLEWQKRGVLHYHALIGRIPAFQGRGYRELASADWQSLSGGFAFIEQIQQTEGAIAYVSKYTRKGGEVDFSATLQLPDLLAASTSAV
jgi:hypothetical protein